MSDPIAAGLRALSEFQEASGSFASYSSPHPGDFRDATRYKTTFAPALILQALCSVPGSKELREQLAAFLHKEVGENGLYNYWSKDEPRRSTSPYPDDFDDTSLAYAALHLHNPTLLTPAEIAKVIRGLTTVEIKPGGPYRTWMVNSTAKSIWHDTDLVVNANISYFLHLLEVQLEPLQTFLKTAITQDALASPYYPSSITVAYFLSRTVHHPALKRHILTARHENQTWGSPLDTALAVTSLLRLGTPASELDGAIDSLRTSQVDGSWPAYAICIDPAQSGITHYAGSSAITTAFCLEALALHDRPSPRKKRTVTPYHSIRRAVFNEVEQVIFEAPQPIRTQLTTALKRTKRTDSKNPLSILAAAFADTLPAGPHPENDLLIRLGAGTTWGWLAYTILDDIFDADISTDLLPAATLAHREMVTTFLGVDIPGFPALFRTTINRIDGANAWEAEACRFIPGLPLSKVRIPDYTDLHHLAHRSFGHALGPLAILLWRQLPLESAEAFFTHFLIARQLNDDAHDWEEDLLKGQVNAVGAHILRAATLADAQFAAQRKDLRTFFWNECAPDICNLMLEHTQKARDLVPSFAASIELFEQLLVPIERSANQALTQREESLAFLAAYTQIS